MMKSRLILVWVIISLAFLLPLQSAQKEKELSPEHREWLELVSPIITKTEREVFLQLKTGEERSRFVQVFWKQRDSLPDTSKNEFYEEFMGRVQFADRYFGHETTRRGSQTERGYFYLLLGPPLDRQFFTTNSELVPLELWNYKGEEKYGLPPYFYLIFYQPQGMGEYKLYYPGIEGPEKLVSPTLADRNLSRIETYRKIRELSAELASATLSYLPGETDTGGSFSSNTIISTVYSLAEKKFSDSYARSYLTFKDYVETDYSHNFIESNYRVNVFRNFHQYFLHWAIEPKQVNFALSQGKYYAEFQFLVRMEDNQGNPVLEREEEIPLVITPEQYKEHERQFFSLQDVLPVIPGSYTCFFLVKNKTAKDFTSFEKKVFIPDQGSGPLMSDLLLFHRQQELSGSGRTFKAYTFAGVHYLVNSQNDFLPQEEMGVYCQVFNLETSGPVSDFTVLLTVASAEDKSIAKTERMPLRDVFHRESEGVLIKPFSLSSLKPGYYELVLSILDGKGRPVLSEKEAFVLLSQPYQVVPWVYSRNHSAFPDAGQLYLLSTQYFLSGNYPEAKVHLEKALKMKDEPGTRLLLAKTLYALSNYRESLTEALPLHQATGDREAAKIIALDYAALQEWASALVYLEKLMAEATEVSVLNLAAECYLNLKQPGKALPLLQKSLSLNPAQASIKELEQKTRNLLDKNKDK